MKKLNKAQRGIAAATRKHGRAQAKFNDLRFIGAQLESLSQGQNEIRSMLAVPPPNGAVAHSVEVSKRVDELRYQTKQAVNGLKDLINTHVAAYEKRLAELEFQFPMLLNRVKELEAKLASKPKRK